jgi:hypothetical protein
VLIQHHVPFDLLHEEEIDRIDAYPGVILAGQDCVSDAQLAKLLHYVRAGGTVFAQLLATGSHHELSAAFDLSRFVTGELIDESHAGVQH